MTARRALVFISLVAALHGLFFLWYQRPDWHTEWTDQDGYRRLGQVLAETGKFTRYPDAPVFVPEVLRTPAYPMFVAVVYRLFGVSHMAVALAQTAVFVLICLIVYAAARWVLPERLAFAAAAATALYPPLPYFGALVMTELWTAFVFTAAMWATLRAAHAPAAGRFALAGLLLAVTALSRPVFVLFPAALALVGLILVPLLRVRPRPRSREWTIMLAAAGLTMLPWFTYNYVTLGQFTMSPAGGVGRGIWEGSWQAVWPGRLQNELTEAGERASDRAALDAQIEAIARRERQDPALMLEYVHQWAAIRRIWTEPADPQQRAQARVAADREYLRAGLDNIRRQPAADIGKRLARGIFILWAGDIPFRYSTINGLPPIVIRACWAIQALVMAAALVGLYALIRVGRPLDALVLGAPILYVTAVHVLLLTEARQSLPAKPIVLLLATGGVAWMTARHALLSLEPQVHERQHL